MFNKHSQKGFTIVELLIVIVVIGILIALIFNLVSGIQRRDRDVERQNDISSIATKLEIYYNNNSGYPALTNQIASDEWVKSNLKDSDLSWLRTPGSAANSMTASTDTSHYGYETLAIDGKTSCATAPCAKFRLTWTKEEDSSVQTKDSLH